MTQSERVDPKVKAHPDYSEGYFAGLNDQFHRGETPEYEAGYRAGGKARETFERAGMRQSGDSEFRISFTLPPQTQSERSGHE
jgi:hypothetical protein